MAETEFHAKLHEAATAATTQKQPAPKMDDSGDTGIILVHKENAEGALQIGNKSGEVKGPADERPEWAEGLLVALLAERQLFWEARRGKTEEEAHAEQAIAYEDLGWIVLNEDGVSQSEQEADIEWRMNAIAERSGFTRTNSLDDTVVFQKEPIASATISFDADMSESELRAFQEAQDTEFKKLTDLDFSKKSAQG